MERDVREAGATSGEPTWSPADHPEQILGVRSEQRMVLPKGPRLPAGKQNGRRGDTADLRTLVSASVQWPHIKVTALTQHQANPSLLPSPASSQRVPLASYNSLSCLSFPLCKMGLCVLCLVAQSCPPLCDPMDYRSPPGTSVHGDSPARILERLAMPSSRGSSQPRSSALQVYSLPAELPVKPKMGLNLTSSMRRLALSQVSF